MVTLTGELVRVQMKRKKIDIEDAAENISSFIIGKLALARISNNLNTLEHGLLSGLKKLLNIRED
mgnify:CR=1 FL=1